MKIPTIEKLPPAVVLSEKNILFRKMVLLEDFTYDEVFLDRRHRIIFDAINYNKYLGESSLIYYLKVGGQLEAAGGENYIHEIFCGYEPEVA